MVQSCPEKQVIHHAQEIIPFQSDFDHPDNGKHLASETWNTTLIDSEATNTVAGKVLYNCYVASLNTDEKRNIRHYKGTNTYRLEGGNLFTISENGEIPNLMGSKHVILNTDITEKDIPLLLSSISMKNVDMTLDFKNDNAMVFGEPIMLITQNLLHPITPYNILLRNVNSGIKTHVTLIATENDKSKYDNALKLHQQFPHPPPERTGKLLNC